MPVDFSHRRKIALQVFVDLVVIWICCQIICCLLPIDESFVIFFYVIILAPYIAGKTPE